MSDTWMRDKRRGDLISTRSFCLRTDSLYVYFYKLTLEIYWPHFSNRPGFGFFAPTLFTWRPDMSWAWDYAAAIQLLGFGLGVAWNHCDNPSHATKEKSK